MAMITSRIRRKSTVVPLDPGGELPEVVRHSLPVGFEAVAESLAAGNGAAAACAVVGRDVARDGASLGEALSGLRVTFELVTGGPPDFSATEALSVAWSEATLEHLHQISCEDPLTGLASLAHVRTRLDEVYREAERANRPVETEHALVVVETKAMWEPRTAEHSFTRALRLVRLSEGIRIVFSGGETIGRLGLDRAVVVVRRDNALGRSVATLREFLGDLDLGPAVVRVWIEGLPRSADSAAQLLDELAR